MPATDPVVIAAIGAGGAMLGALVGSAAKGVADYVLAKRQSDAQAEAAARLVTQEIHGAMARVDFAVKQGMSHGVQLPREEWDATRDVLAHHVKGPHWRDLYFWYHMVHGFNMLRPDAPIDSEAAPDFQGHANDALAALHACIPKAFASRRQPQRLPP